MRPRVYIKQSQVNTADNQIWVLKTEVHELKFVSMIGGFGQFLRKHGIERPQVHNMNSIEPLQPIQAFVSWFL